MKNPKLGKTGEFPRGQLNKDDEGEIQFGVAADLPNQVVVVQFGTPVAWLGLPPEKARQFAAMLLRAAGKIDGKTVTATVVGMGDAS